MNTKLKITKTILTCSLLVAPLSYNLSSSSIAKATNESNTNKTNIYNSNLNLSNTNIDTLNTNIDTLNLSNDALGQIKPLYDGWAGSNGVTHVIYMDFNTCYEYAMRNNSSPLRSLFFGLGASFFKPWVGVATAVADYVIGQLHGTLYYKCHEAVRQRKGVLIRFVSYKVNYWTYPTIRVAYYSIM